MIVTKRIEGEVEFNDGEFAEVQTYGIEGIEKNLLLQTIQIHREDTDNTSNEFQKRFSVGTVLEITTTTELTIQEPGLDGQDLRTAVTGSRVNWNEDMSQSESKLSSQAIVYFVISPLEGPAYRICGDDDLQAVGGVHALERRFENESYWFARMGQLSLKLNSDGVTFQDSDLAELPEPLEGAWQTGRLNPAFRQSEIEKRAFQEVFQEIQRMLDSWRTTDGTTVEAFALKELKISARG
jgi:hypothetical protein